MGKIGALIMVTFSIVAAIKFVKSEQIFFVLLAIKNFIASYYLFIRNPSQDRMQSKYFSFVVYFSAALPLFYSANDNAVTRSILLAMDLCSIVGFSLMAMALLDLGKSFGVTPANRGIVTSGIYRYFNHPMYIGYVIAEFGFALLGGLNLLLFGFSVILYLVRAKQENNVLGRNSNKTPALG